MFASFPQRPVFPHFHSFSLTLITPFDSIFLAHLANFQNYPSVHRKEQTANKLKLQPLNPIEWKEKMKMNKNRST